MTRGRELTLRLTRTWALAGLVCFLAGAPPALGQSSRQLSGGVVRVVDGDTIQVRLGDRTETVRYIGINAPEMSPPTGGEEPGAREATEGNRRLVEGQIVRLELDVEERDRYGRVLAYVYVSGMMVNSELVAQGYAQVMTIPPNVKHQALLLKFQREARLLQIGLWRGTGPLPLEPGGSPPAGSRLAQTAQARPGVPPQDGWTCPASHPIKGNFTTHSGERCIYHAPAAASMARLSRSAAMPRRQMA